METGRTKEDNLSLNINFFPPILKTNFFCGCSLKYIFLLNFFLFYPLLSIIFVYFRCKVYYIDLGSIELCHNQEIFQYSHIFEVCREQAFCCKEPDCLKTHSFQNWKGFFLVKNDNYREVFLRYFFLI